jgi:hypothetical protein
MSIEKPPRKARASRPSLTAKPTGLLVGVLSVTGRVPFASTIRELAVEPDSVGFGRAYWAARLPAAVVREGGPSRPQ